MLSAQYVAFAHYPYTHVPTVEWMDQQPVIIIHHVREQERCPSKEASLCQLPDSPLACYFSYTCSPQGAGSSLHLQQFHWNAFCMYSEMGKVWSWDAFEGLVQEVLISPSWMGSPILLSGKEAGAAQREGLWLEPGTLGIDTTGSAGRHQVMKLQQKLGRRELPWWSFRLKKMRWSEIRGEWRFWLQILWCHAEW